MTELSAVSEKGRAIQLGEEGTAATTPTEGAAAADGGEGAEVSQWQLLLSSEQTEAPTKFGAIRAAAKKRQREMDRRLEKMFTVESQLNEALRGGANYKQVAHLLKKQSHLQLLKDDPLTDELGELTYRQQGNLGMYTTQNMKLRENNRYDANVKAAIDHFWSILPKTNRGFVNKSIYTWYTRKLYNALVPEGTEEEFQRVVHEDWKNDAVWSSSMNDRMFHNAAFQLADIWCETTDANEYRDFLLKCASLVEQPPPYTGGREDVSAVGTDRRATVAARRMSVSSRSSKAESFQEDEDEGGPDVAVKPDEEYLATIEELETELTDADAEGWLEVLDNLQEYQIEEAEDDGDEVFRLLRDIQERRFALLHDDSDCSFQFEKAFNDELRILCTERGERREMFHLRLDKIRYEGTTPTKSILERATKRKKLQLRRMKEQDKFFDIIRDSMMKTTTRNQEFRNTITDLTKDLLNQRIANVEADEEILLFNGLQLSNVERKQKTDADARSQFYSYFVTLCKDLQDAWSLLRQRMMDNLGESIFPEGSEHRSFKFHHPSWGGVIEWVRRLRNRRWELVSDALRSLQDAIRSLEMTGKEDLFAVHRQQMQREGKMLDVIANEPVMPHETKMKLMKRAQEEKREAQKRRTKELGEFDTIMKEFCDEFDVLKSGVEKRKNAEKREEEGWKKAKSVEDAFAASKPLLQLYATEFAELMTVTEGSVNENLRDMLRAADAVVLPSDVNSATDYLSFFLHQTDESWFLLLEKIASLRVQILEQSNGWYARLEAQEEQTQLRQSLAIIRRRMDEVEGYRERLNDTNGKLKPEAKKLMEERLKMWDAFQELLKAELEEQESLASDIDRRKNIQLEKCKERRARAKKLYEVLRYNYFKMTELEMMRVRRLESYKYSQHLAEKHEAQEDEAEKQMREWREKEKDRMTYARKKREQEAKEREALRLKALEEAEKERKEIEANKARSEQQRHELRQRQLAERERRQKERIAKEKAERVRLREEFLKQLEEHKELERKRAAEEQIRCSLRGGPSFDNSSFDTRSPVEKTLKPLPPSDPKPAVAPRGGPAKKMTAQPPKKKPTGPSSRRANHYNETPPKTPEAPRKSMKDKLKKAIEEEIRSFQKLDTQSLVVDFEDFDTRRRDYLIEELSNLDIYVSECQRLGLPPSEDAKKVLSNLCLDFTALAINMAGCKTAQLPALLDIFRMNPIQHLILPNTDMEKDVLKKFCQIAMKHPFIHAIDVSDNPELGPHGGQSLLSLVQSNAAISKVSMSGCGIPDDVAAQIHKVCNDNAFARTIGRSDFNCLRSIFDEIDTDGSGTVSLRELRAYNDKQASLMVSQSSAATSRAFTSLVGGKASTLERMQQTLSNRVSQVRDILLSLDRRGEDNFTLADLITFVFPSWTVERAEELIAQYLDESVATPSLEELQEFIDSFGSNGTLTLAQLARGLGVDDYESLRPAFEEADILSDGLLNLEEFLRFVEV